MSESQQLETRPYCTVCKRKRDLSHFIRGGPSDLYRTCSLCRVKAKAVYEQRRVEREFCSVCGKEYPKLTLKNHQRGAGHIRRENCLREKVSPVEIMAV